MEGLAARDFNEAALQVSATAKTTFDEAKEVVKALRGFVEELKGELRRALKEREAGKEPGSQDLARAVALEVALEGKSDIITEIWAATSLPGITALCICRAA
ncbi:MAG: hypothetical protein JZD41_01420 [Thermoproteus sp.]|nr:hypothetical protein [Thermoproteus sp.]